MKPGIRMLLMADRDKRREYDRGYDRDSISREPQRYETRNDWLESKFRDNRGREHYDNGRYAPMNAYPPYVPPVYGNPRREEYRPMNRIGFATDNYDEHERNAGHYRQDGTYPRMNEMDYGRHGEYRSGYAAGAGMALDKQMADEWTKNMENEDGSRGAHWTMEQTKQVQQQRGIDCDPLEFFVAMNMIYSDYCKVAKKYGVGDKVDFYAEMAKAFLDDKDAQPEKLARYYECIVKH